MRIGSCKKLPWLGGSITYVYGGREPRSANTGFKLQLGVQYFNLPPDGICDLSHQEALGLLYLDFVFLQVTFLLCLSRLIYQEKEKYCPVNQIFHFSSLLYFLGFLYSPFLISVVGWWWARGIFSLLMMWDKLKYLFLNYNSLLWIITPRLFFLITYDKNKLNFLHLTYY